MLKRSLLVICLLFVSMFLFTGCKNNDDHIHIYGDNKVYYLTSEGKDYYTQKCLEDDHINKVEQDEKYELQSLISSAIKGDTIIIQRDINKSVDSPLTYIVNKAITIMSDLENKPKIYGNIRIQLDDNEIESVTIKNLEIIHNGLLQYDSNVTPMVGKDERRGILVVNGSVVIEDNYIHLKEENPIQRLPTASTGIQISVSENNEYKNQYTYTISNNTLGKYSRSQTTSSSEPTSILLDYDVNAKINLDINDCKEIYTSNTFDDESECYLAAFDYESYVYIAGFFPTLDIAKVYLGNNYEYVSSELELVHQDNIYQLIVKQ